MIHVFEKCVKLNPTVIISSGGPRFLNMWGTIYFFIENAFEFSFFDKSLVLFENLFLVISEFGIKYS